MKPHDNARLCERELELPGLAYVLDKDLLYGLLLQRGIIGPHQACELSYIRYKRGTRALALASVANEAGSSIPLVVTSYNAQTWKKFTDRHTSSQNGAAVILLPQLMCSLEWFPFDPQLKQLKKLFNPERTSSIMRRVVGENSRRSDAWQLTAQTYKPRRRFVAHAICEDSQLAVKCYTAEDFENARRNAQLVTRELMGDLVPELLACNARYSTIAWEWLDGETLNKNLDQAHAQSLLRMTGAMLRHWHQRTQKTMTMVDWQHPGFSKASLRAIIDDVTWLAPDLSVPLSELLGQIDGRLSSMEEATDLIHGDFYAKQVVVQADCLRLIDFDEIGRGSRYQDLGNFIGHMYWEATRDLPATTSKPIDLDSAIESFLEGYEQNTLLDRRLLNAAAVAGILRCLPHTFRRGLPDWESRMRLMIESAKLWVDKQPVIATDRQPIVAPVDPVEPQFDQQQTDDNISRYLNLRNINTELQQLRDVSPQLAETTVVDANLFRYKPTKRVLIEYTLENQLRSQQIQLIGKARLHKSIDERLLRLHEDLQSLRKLGIHVPQVVGNLPRMNMWLQEKLVGQHLFYTNDASLHRPVGAALAELHSCKTSINRSHTLEQEMAYLREQYARWLLSSPSWAELGQSVLKEVEEQANCLDKSEIVLLHRDFYFDQVLIVQDGVGLLDLDLAAMGPAELDVGNYLAHLDEYGLRFSEFEGYCRNAAEEFMSGYQERRPEIRHDNVEIWRLLSLARLAAISQRMPSRRESTGKVLRSCCARVNC